MDTDDIINTAAVDRQHRHHAHSHHHSQHRASQHHSLRSSSPAGDAEDGVEVAEAAADMRRRLAIEEEIRHQQREAEAAVMRGAMGRLSRPSITGSSPQSYSVSRGESPNVSRRHGSHSPSSLMGDDDGDDAARSTPHRMTGSVFPGTTARFPDRYSPYARARADSGSPPSQLPPPCHPSLGQHIPTPNGNSGMHASWHRTSSLLAEDLALRFRQGFSQAPTLGPPPHHHHLPPPPPHHPSLSRHNCLSPPPPSHLGPHHPLPHSLPHQLQHPASSMVTPLSTSSSAIDHSDSAPPRDDLQNTGSSSPGHHWTFEEQFKQVCTTV